MGLLKRDKGAVLITSIFIVLLIATLGIGLLMLVNTQLEIANVSLNSARAFYCADSGVAETIVYLRDIPDWLSVSGVIPLTLTGVGGGNFGVEVVTNTGPSTITVNSTGTFANFQRIIQVTLVRIVSPDGASIIKEGWKEI